MTTTDERPLVTMSGADLKLTEDQHSWSGAQVAALEQLGLTNAADGDMQVFFHVCKRTGLDPFARQIYMIYRNDPTAPSGRKATIQTGIDGGRLVAQRASRRDRVTYGYEDTQYRKHDGTWTDCWDDPDLNPVAVKVTVLRDGMRFPHIAHWREFVQTKNNKPTRMWTQMPSNQLAKCAEMGALRKAFPLDLSGIYEQAEMVAGAIDGAAPDTPNPDALPVAEAVQALYAQAVAATGDGKALAQVWADGRAANLLDEPITHQGVAGKLGNLILHLRNAGAPDQTKPTEPKADEPVDADIVTEDLPQAGGTAESVATDASGQTEPSTPAVPPDPLPTGPLPCGCDPDEVWSQGHRDDCPLRSES